MIDRESDPQRDFIDLNSRRVSILLWKFEV